MVLSMSGVALYNGVAQHTHSIDYGMPATSHYDNTAPLGHYIAARFMYTGPKMVISYQVPGTAQNKTPTQTSHETSQPTQFFCANTGEKRKPPRSKNIIISLELLQRYARQPLHPHNPHNLPWFQPSAPSTPPPN